MHLTTLGGLKLEPSDFHRPKPLLLLAYLAIEGAKDRRHLAELFWPEASEPATSLRVALGQLRKGAAEAVSDDTQKLSLGVACDAMELLEAIRDHHLERVPSLYAGAFLEGFALPDWSAELEEWVYATREFIASQVRASLVRAAEAEAVRGEFARAASHAEAAYRLRNAKPLEPDELERLHAILVAGDSPFAPDVRREAEEFGLGLRINQEEARARLAPNVSRKTSRPSPRAIPNNLPTARTSFIGRDPELVEVGGLLERGEARLVTLLGPGGIGKTRLALQVAHDQLQGNRFVGGVYFIALESLTSLDQIPRAIADALGVTVQGNTDPLEAVIGFVGNGVVLTVLDNFEHLVEGAELVSRLLERCPNLTLLVTSRERLQLEEEFALPIIGLPVPASTSSLADAEPNDAVRLFVQRAKRARIDFSLLETDLPHVLEICGVLEGSPLGIELAAAWVKALPVGEIAREIRQNLDLLETPARNAREGHRSLRAVFERSWKLLTPREQEVFARLAVFHGGFTREAAGEVAGATIPVLASLMDKSLLRVDAQGRYDRHALVYQYALEKLGERPQAQAEAAHKHAAYFRALAQASAPHHTGPDQRRYLDALEVELPNLRAALGLMERDADATAMLAMCGHLIHLFLIRGHFAEGRDWHARALRLPDADQAGLSYAKGLSNSAVLAKWQGDQEAFQALLERALPAARQAGNAGYVANVLNNLVISHQMRGETGAALERAREGLKVAREDGELWRITSALERLAAVHFDLGDYEAARSFAEECLGMLRPTGRKRDLAIALSTLGEILACQDEPVRALACHEEARATFEEIGDVPNAAYAVHNIGDLNLRLLDFASARARYQQSLATLAPLGERYAIPYSLEGMAATLAAQGHPERAARLWGASEVLRERLPNRLSPRQRQEHERRVAAARHHLPAAAFEAAWAEGRVLTLEQAVALALEPHTETSSEAVHVPTESR